MQKKNPSIFFQTKLGKMIHGDSSQILLEQEKHSVDLIVTSPPFALIRKKDYGNVDEKEYLEWFKPFAASFRQVLKESGSLVIDIGGSWIPRQPTRSLYHFKLLVMLCEEFGFHLAQEFYWWNPAKLPTPVEWVTVRRIRVKDAINCIWWLSPTPWPKATNRRVLQPYSERMWNLLKNGCQAMKRPLGHEISDKFSRDNGASIPPNLLAIPNTKSNSPYLRYCQEHKLTPHPARFPGRLPEFFIRMLTDKNDLVVDPFAGSCVTGEVCEKIGRKWICIELNREYLKGEMGRFELRSNSGVKEGAKSYQVFQPGYGWDGEEPPLSTDGGRKRSLKKRS